MPIESFVTTFFADWLNWTFFWWRTLFALSQNATACDNKLQIAVRNDMRLFLRFTKYYSSTTLYYKVHKRTTLHYKVYSVLQSATPVLLCTTQHYSVVQTTTPVLLCTTKYYSSTTLYYTVLLQYYSSTTLYYTVLLQYYSVLQSTTPVLLCTTKYYSVLQTHQILRLPRKMTVQNLTEICWKRMKRHFQCAADPTMIREWSEHDPSMIRPWNRQSATRLATEVPFHAHHEHFVLKNTTFRAPAIIPNFTEYCACHEKWHLNFTKYCAWHKKWISWLILDTYETLFTMRRATCVIVQTHQILRLPRKMNLMIDPWHKWNVIYNARSNMRHCPNSPNTAPATKNDSPDWSLTKMKRYLQCAEQHASLSKLTKYCACHEKWISWLILDTNETLFTMRGATCVIVQTHQILRLPRKMTVQNLKEICWKRMKCHFQCAADPTMIRAWSDHDPSMIRAWSDHETVSPQPASQPRWPFTPTTSILYWKIQHFALRLSFQISPNTAPATKSDTCTSPNTAPATKSDTCTSPNTAPATKNESHDWSLTQMKRYLQCAEQHASLSKLTKYCACHEKWISWLILDTNETLFTMRGATCVIVQTHQILRLPRKMTVQNLKEICWKRMKRHFQCAADPTMIRAWSDHDPSMIRAWSDHETVSPQPASQPRWPFTPTTSILYWKIQHFALRLSFQISPNTAPATKSDTCTSPNTAPATKSDTCTSPNTAPATKNESHDWSLTQMKRYLQCAEQHAS